MNLKLTPEQERIIRDELKAGHFRSAEELIAQALEALRRQGHPLLDDKAKGNPSLTQEMAVKDMLTFVEKNHVRLSGISVKDLIHEGHRL